jgi:hypothetical protein
MRVAALISGQPRFCKDFDMQLEHLKNDEPIDWFFYLWNKNSQNYWNSTPNNLLDCTPEYMRDYIKDRLPKNHRLTVIESLPPINVDNIKSKNYIRSGGPSPEDNYLMYYGIFKVNELRRNYEQEFGEYDLVIRTRPDVSLINDLDLKNIKNYLDNNPNAIITPSNNRYGHGPTNDQFAIGTSEVMSRYADAVNNLDYLYVSRGINYDPEVMLFHHMEYVGIHDHFSDFIVPLRSSMQFVNGVPTTDFGSWA